MFDLLTYYAYVFVPCTGIWKSGQRFNLSGPKIMHKTINTRSLARFIYFFNLIKSFNYSQNLLLESFNISHTHHAARSESVWLFFYAIFKYCGCVVLPIDEDICK